MAGVGDRAMGSSAWAGTYTSPPQPDSGPRTQTGQNGRVRPANHVAAWSGCQPAEWWASPQAWKG
jgi:hypothetical protein